MALLKVNPCLPAGRLSPYGPGWKDKSSPMGRDIGRKIEGCNPKLITSCLARIEMSCSKVLRCLFFGRRHHGRKGHYNGDPGRTEAVTRH